ncbi:ribosomal RNA-processing protein 8 [Condylostylus longicornis]|uniref:ribosomal RNA-processing protein 8 n=1 Tax=Condylostylus longicornis TaxID=2530218 RepID=UPI00244E51AC|nr:ribosomal RNA-processing protein 8 [Condylostylus longicornis]
MKHIFEINDDWDDNTELSKFETKKSKQRLEKLEKNDEVKKTQTESGKSKNRKVKIKKHLLENQVKSITTNGCDLPVVNLQTEPKNKKKKKLAIEKFDGNCKFTPLLRKNVISEDNSMIDNEICVEKKKSKKRKLDHLDNGDMVKKQKIATATKLDDGPLKKNSLNKNLPTSSFANKLRDNLLGGRFRFLNELLYTTTGSKAKEMFEQDREAFKAYHKGYRQQIEKWPFNPLDRIIKRVRKLPKHMIVADFGCGEAKLAESVPHKCFSIDFISSKPHVIACDMANTPLKSQSIDIVIFCLSLMGTNLNDFICEANRILKSDGIVYVAEIGSRFENVKDFKSLWEHFGFELLRQDVDKKKYFYFFDFKKIENVKKNVLSISNCKLKPCIYKKR